jgi:HEAT repeat protein
MAEWQRAVQEGAAGPEDHSQGYALHPDEKLHAVELSIREYAVAHEELLRRVLASSSGREHRAVAATFTGYANQSPPQIAALVSATRDPDETVRNNATRALGALADGRKITLPADGFIEMLASGNWMDRNKAMMVLAPLTASGSPELLARIRARAIDALTEMSRWQCPDHSWAARDLLARVAR